MVLKRDFYNILNFLEHLLELVEFFELSTEMLKVVWDAFLGIEFAKHDS